MQPIESNFEAILVAIPMLLVLFGSFFRLDESLSGTVKRTQRRRSFSHQDGAGVLVCVEPDGRQHREPRGR